MFEVMIISCKTISIYDGNMSIHMKNGSLASRPSVPHRILQSFTELWAGQEYHHDPLGDKIMGSNEMTSKMHFSTSWVPFMCNMKTILLSITELWAEKTILLARQQYNIDPRGDKFF